MVCIHHVHYKLFVVLFITDIDLSELFRSAYAGQCLIILIMFQYYMSLGFTANLVV